jgi:hypothetical protein
MRWANEDRWTDIIKSAADRHGVPYTLVQAVIGRESAFNPSAYRAEPAIGDGSAGLMQILLRTARGVGYTGPLGDSKALTGLFDPATNIEYGTAYLAEQYRRAGNAAGAVSAYNGGWRPELGFGRPASKALRLCLARSQTTGECIRWADVQPGRYGNQSHVDAVLSNLEYFEAKRRADSPLGIVTSPVTEAGTVNPKLIAALVGLLLGLLGLRFRGR